MILYHVVFIYAPWNNKSARLIALFAVFVDELAADCVVTSTSIWIRWFSTELMEAAGWSCVIWSFSDYENKESQ